MILLKMILILEMTSESEGESDAQIAECQNPTCKAKGPKEDVSTRCSTRKRNILG